MKRIVFATVLVFSILLFDFSAVSKAFACAKSDDLVVHEWGTFTSVAGKDGVAIDWRPLNGASDLPSFVYDFNKLSVRNGLRGTFYDPGKGALSRVRMETPVIYFYAPDEMNVDVRVDFPRGKVTEWYPQAGVVNAHYSPSRRGRFETGIDWGTIRLVPNAPPNFPREAAASHYYPARETDAVPVQAANADKTRIETEKFLFYRGIGNFDLPLTVKLNGAQIELATSGEELKNLIVFENRGGKIGFRFIETLSKQATIERPETFDSLDDVLFKLKHVLVSEGLYEKEAVAMIKTWRDSWFEEGLRVFYVLPRAATDAILPLTVKPQPKEIIRVLVGRAELITPEMEREARKQVVLLASPAKSARLAARNNLRKHGRFYEPVLKSLARNEKSAKIRAQIRKLLRSA